jgi:predicted negative regulator of RcsB-dependent stress response
LRQPPLDSALISTDPDELPRAAGLLGDLFVQQNRVDAAEHAYRAAIDVGDEYWSPIAQVALAQLLSDRGGREEARTLLEAVVASGHPRTASVAQAALSDLSTRQASLDAFGPSLGAYETLSDPASARRSRGVSVDPLSKARR